MQTHVAQRPKDFQNCSENYCYITSNLMSSPLDKRIALARSVSVGSWANGNMANKMVIFLHMPFGLLSSWLCVEVQLRPLRKRERKEEERCMQMKHKPKKTEFMFCTLSTKFSTWPLSLGRGEECNVLMFHYKPTCHSVEWAVIRREGGLKRKLRSAVYGKLGVI